MAGGHGIDRGGAVVVVSVEGGCGEGVVLVVPLSGGRLFDCERGDGGAYYFLYGWRDGVGDRGDMVAEFEEVNLCMNRTDYDAVVVGAGPNGLAAAIYLQQRGLSVLLVEGRSTVGGGMRSEELTLPGFIHDVCSAVHPTAAGSPFFSGLPLGEFGLEYVYPRVAAAHPFDGGGAALLVGGVEETAAGFGRDGGAYERLMGPVVRDWGVLGPQLLGPLRFPGRAKGMNEVPEESKGTNGVPEESKGTKEEEQGTQLRRSSRGTKLSRSSGLVTGGGLGVLGLAGFGLKALQPVTKLARRFEGKEVRGLMAGMAAHAIQPLDNIATASFALVLMALGHVRGWPVARGGSGRIGEALAAYFVKLGGKIWTGVYVRSLSQLPSSRALLLDMTPRQLLQLGGHRWSWLYERQLQRYRYGMGVFKMDWALDGPVPWADERCRDAGTVHLGGTLEEIVASEAMTAAGGYPQLPFVLLAQPGVVDGSRAPEGKQVVWAYCHVPNGSVVDMGGAIERQIERFAPGFRERVLGRHVYNTAELEEYNPNYIGGDINGGIIDICQLFTRPALRWSPYRTSEKGIYICSAATPPGGGVHGMCGYWAARRAFKDIFVRG